MTKILKFFIIGTIFINLFILFSTVTAQTQQSDQDITMLQERVNYLVEINDKMVNNVYWILGTFATIFLVIVGLNFWSNFSAGKEKIDSIKKEFENLINSQINTLKGDIQNISEENKEKSRKDFDKLIDETQKKLDIYKGDTLIEIKKQEDKWSAETARSMALYCGETKDYANAFIHSLTAAYKFGQTKEDELSTAWIEAVEKNLTSGNSLDFDASFFDKNLKEIRSLLSSLKLKHEIGIARIEKILEQKIDQAKQINLLPQEK